jgi:hypothetical protein
MSHVGRAAGLACWAGGLAMLALGQAPSAAAQSPCRNVAIRSPVTGEVVSGTVPVLGSAQIDGFQFYKVEWAPASEPDVWRAVSDVRREAVINGLLDQWHTAPVPDGTYRLKLTVVDQAAVEVCRALVEDVVVGAAATPTETATATATATEVPEEPTAEPTTEPTGATGPDEVTAAASAAPAPTPTLAAIVPETGDAATTTATVSMGGLLGAFTGGFCLTLLAAVLLVTLFGRRGAR